MGEISPNLVALLASSWQSSEGYCFEMSKKQATPRRPKDH
jgi:hypothetical protein